LTDVVPTSTPMVSELLPDDLGAAVERDINLKRFST